MSNKAVILGANYYIGLSAIRCLGIHGIHVTAIDYSEKETYGFHSRYCSEALIAPHYKKDPEGFLSFLIDYAKKQDSPPVLFPCADQYVEFVDEHLPELRKYYLIPQTEQGLYTKLMKKHILYSMAKDHGVLVPETLSPNEENLIQKVEETIKYPCIVKPVDSAAFVAKFRRKVFKVHNSDELLDALKKSSEAGLEVMIQRIIPGFDDHMYTFDAYMNQEGKVTHTVTCQKFRQYPINFGASVYTGQRFVPEIQDIGTKFFEAIKYKGFAEIEFKKDSETGRFYLIEVNVRITNLNSLLYKTGINIPYITYRELTGNPVEPHFVTHDTNIVFWYAFEDFLAVRDYIRTGQLTLSQVLRSYFKPKAYAIWDPKDPKPAFAFLRKLAIHGLRKITRR